MEITLQNAFEVETSHVELLAQPLTQPVLLSEEELCWVSGGKTDGPVNGW